jgi:hypothetical protein
MRLKFCPAHSLYSIVRESVPLGILRAGEERSRAINDKEGDKE